MSDLRRREQPQQETGGHDFIAAIRELRTPGAVESFVLDYYTWLGQSDEITNRASLVRAVIQLALGNYKDSNPKDYDDVVKLWEDAAKKLSESH